MKTVAAELYKRCRARAAKMGMECTLSLADIHALLVAANGRCSVSGAPLDYGPGQHRRRPWFPSVDRLDSRRGYVAGNVRIVACAVNVAMNEWGEGVLRRIAHYLVRKLAASDPKGNKADRFARDRRLNFSRLSPRAPEEGVAADSNALKVEELV